MLNKVINNRFSGLLLRILVHLGLYKSVRTLFISYSRYQSRRTFKNINKDFILDLPEKVIFEPTFRCNLKCTMCYQNRIAAKEKELSIGQIEYIFSNQVSGIEKVNLIGGEIFVRKDIYKIIALLERKNISVHITTNGTLIGNSNYQKLLKCRNIQAIGFSIDGPEILHNKMRNSPNAFQKTVQGLKLAQNNFFVFMCSVLSEENVGYLEEIVELAHQLRLDSFIIEFERKYTRKDLKEATSVLEAPESDFPLTLSKSKTPEYSFDFLMKNIEAAERNAKSLGIKIYYLPDSLKERLENHYQKNNRANGRYFCRSMFIGRIDSNGNVFHCYAIRKKFGNLLDNSFSDIWNSEEYREFRRTLTNNNMLSLCETCLYMEPIRYGPDKPNKY